MASAPRDSLAEVSEKGEFVRTPSVFINTLRPEQCVPGRLALFVSLACPWASRCLAVLVLKGLEHVVEVIHCLPTWNVTKPGVDEHRGWVFRARAVGEVEAGMQEVPETDPHFSAATVRGVYDAAAEPDALVHKFTVPLLVDKVTRKIICNESSIIVREFNCKFNKPGLARFPTVDLCPAALAQEIDQVNERMYNSVNNGVYRCGFATTQAAYEEAAADLSAGLDYFEERLSKRRWLVGKQFTESDLRLFVTLVRYDPVYIVHFKTAFRTIRGDYPALLGFMRDVYQTSAATLLSDASTNPAPATVGSTVSMQHIKRHYYCSHNKLNPFAIVPVPHPRELKELSEPHGREKL